MRFYALDQDPVRLAMALADAHVGPFYAAMVRRLATGQRELVEKHQVRLLEMRIRGELPGPTWSRRLEEYAARISPFDPLEDEATEWMHSSLDNLHWAIRLTSYLDGSRAFRQPLDPTLDRIFHYIKIDHLQDPLPRAKTWPFDVSKDRRDYFNDYRSSATWKSSPPRWWTALASLSPTR